jgi:hypothetical protein
MYRSGETLLELQRQDRTRQELGPALGKLTESSGRWTEGWMPLGETLRADMG